MKTEVLAFLHNQRDYFMRESVKYKNQVKNADILQEAIDIIEKHTILVGISDKFENDLLIWFIDGLQVAVNNGISQPTINWMSQGLQIIKRRITGDCV